MAKVESSNGINKIGKDPIIKPNTDPYNYGILQMKIGTARDAAKMIGLAIPESDDELRDLLINDDQKAIMLSAAYLSYLWKVFNHVDLTIIAYNLGPGAVINRLKKGEQLPTEYLEKVKGGWN